MKFFKLCIASVLLMSMSAFAQNGKFVTDQPVYNNLTLAAAKSVNPANAGLIDANPATKTISITYADGVTVENWVFGTSADFSAVFDNFATGTRTQGADWYWAPVYGSNAQRKVSYKSILKSSCAKTTPVGGDFYTATITMKSGLVFTSSGFDIGICARLTD
ncbi:hypothetical protein UNDYM_1669 [Undibacterium sp. YM2]|uniref:hypothetical protein n=1 Tax=Undibacterium sp. YM2 TaxID=2058625 RepID=UPI001331D513|nr:hypothetical protein [Undibacterium sp. YM2]BBB65922.1 hypothetical protein UNDYM_1669 [Undibacterium sp. YM2]